MSVRSAALLSLSCLLGTSPAWAQSLSGQAATDLDLKNYAKGLSLPTDIAVLPDGRGVVTQKLGDVLVFEGGVKTTAGHLNVEQNINEQGLLGVVADPNFATNHYLYFYADVGGTNDKHQIIRIVLGDDNMLGAQTVIMGTGAPTPGVLGPANHDGGGMVIYNNQLYIGIGDTGANTSPPTNKFGSCLNHANGKILRLNLDGTVPTDNPLSNVASATACDTQNSAFTMAPPDKRIFAWGLRNPFRFWIDPSGAQAGTLWIGDVGEVTREEVSVGHGNTHYGYPFVEGTMDWGAALLPNECEGMTPAKACTPPVYDYGHSAGNNCIIGGLVIDGCGWSAAWKSRYVFGDNGSGNVWTLEVNAARTGVNPGGVTVFGKVNGPSAFRMGPDGALYIVEVGGNAVERITPKGQPASCAAPDGGPPGGTGGTTASGGATAGGGANTAGANAAGAGNGTGGRSGVGGSGTGMAGTSTGQSGSGQGAIDGGVGRAGSGDSGGCGCRSAAPGRMGHNAALAMMGAIAAAAMRRRRARRESAK